MARKTALTRRYLAAAVAVGVASTLCLVVQAVLIGLVVQRAFLEHRPVGHLVPLLAGLAGAFATRAALAWLGELAAHRTSASVTSTLRRQLLSRAVALGPSWLSGERTGELVSVATQGVEALEVYFARYLPTAVVAAIAPPILLAWVLWSDWLSFLILAVTVSVIPLFMVLLGMEAKRHAQRQWNRLSGLAAAFYDLLQGLPTLRAFNRARDGRRTLEKAAEDFRVTTMSTLRLAFLSALALEVLAAVGTALVALFLGLRLLDGSLHLAVGLAVLVLAPEVYLPLRRAASEFHASTAGQAAADRILDILDEPVPVAPVRAQAGTLTGRQAAGFGAAVEPYLTALARSTLRLSDLRVSYAARVAPVLDGLDLEVAFGEHVAVTGESGAGKSTLLAVLLGFVIPVAGKLTVGGVELGELPLREWRQQIAWVSQRPYLIRGTIADNLRLADTRAGDRDLARSIEQSGLSGVLERLPRGLGTLVGEGGLTLSAGERQRIAIARAILRDAPLVLLDEPTAHLDAGRELSLAETLGPWLENRTVIVAAHRLGLVGRVDRTLALVGGRLLRVDKADMPVCEPIGARP
ncbi:MAG: thiol reductant ABC exporter subunit CydD [Acidimicrobiales bacterium]